MGEEVDDVHAAPEYDDTRRSVEDGQGGRLPRSSGRDDEDGDGSAGHLSPPG
jgi:hypothetical protein